MKKWKAWIAVLLLLMLSSGCSEETRPEPTAVPADGAVDAAETTALETATPTPQEPEPTAHEPDPTPPEPDPTPEAAEPTTDMPEPTPGETAEYAWPAPLAPYPLLSDTAVTTAEAETLATLNSEFPMERDDVGLAMAYSGLAVEPVMVGTPVSAPRTVGERERFAISNVDLNTISTPEFRLLHLSDHAYFWFDSTAGLSTPEKSVLEETGASFDEIYEQNISFFGEENNPGIDGDPRIHIVNASPLTICDVDESTSHQCGLAGYFGSSDILPKVVDPQSNEREMFVMNGGNFGSPFYLDVLAHEFRHMIESNYDANDWDWEVEGSAMLAEDLLGFPADPIARGNSFLANPDQQLNRWVDGNTLPYYGQGYVINRYIFNRLGAELYKIFATHPQPGFAALDDIAANYEVDFAGGMDLYLDWLAALAIHTEEGAPEQYFINDSLNTASMEGVNEFPVTIETTVSQYAADYYRLFGEGLINLTFSGSNHAQLLKVLPVSGERMWLANRANYSMMRMTREFDLSAVDEATLEYAVFHEIETGYDFAYVSISTDGGQTWLGLTGEQMQGQAPQDDPAEAAYTERFYTGRSGDWLKERVDLSDYTGLEVQVRIEYITDPILTFGGIAIDNISIPEIGFYDDAESEAGWTAEGFVRATGYIPQLWHLLLISFVDGVPVVERLDIDENNELSVDINLDNSGGGRPILIVAASAPMTLEPAYYVVDFQ